MYVRRERNLGPAVTAAAATASSHLVPTSQLVPLLPRLA